VKHTGPRYTLFVYLVCSPEANNVPWPWPCTPRSPHTPETAADRRSRRLSIEECSTPSTGWLLGAAIDARPNEWLRKPRSLDICGPRNCRFDLEGRLGSVQTDSHRHVAQVECAREAGESTNDHPVRPGMSASARVGGVPPAGLCVAKADRVRVYSPSALQCTWLCISACLFW